MNRPLDRRLDELEARRRTRVAVIPHRYPDEPCADALARHVAMHPQDGDADLTVFIRRFSDRRAS